MAHAASNPSVDARQPTASALALLALVALVVAADLLLIASIWPGLSVPLGFTTAAAAASMAGGLVGLAAWWSERRRRQREAAGHDAAVNAVAVQLATARDEIGTLKATVTAHAQEVEHARAAAETAARRGEDALKAEQERLGAEVEQRTSELSEARSQVEASGSRIDELTNTNATLEKQLAERDEALERERHRAAKFQRAREEEREWIGQLRNQIFQLQRERGILSDTADVPALVLRVAVTLLEAKKGLLLARPSGRQDGPLELIASEGFDHDPADSAVAQRFAGEVLERDKIVREDTPHALVAGRGTPADAEIENVVAIPIYLMDEFNGVVVCANRDGGFENCDEEVLLSLGGHAGTLLHGARLQQELRSSYLATVQMLSDAVQAKDGSLRGHCEEVADYAGAVADRMGLDPKQREEVVFGSLLHDVGKIGVSERILLKPGRLTLEEFAVVKLHPKIGFRLVQRVPSLDPIALGILHHHERFDGRGYPAGLRGEEIPREARIIAVADAFSAMVSDRPYRRRMSLAQACKELERGAGTHFDPEIVRLFVDEVRRRPFGEEPASLEAALSDPELQTRLAPGASALGQGPFEVTDSLTLLYSHRYFHELVHAETHRAEVQESPFAVVLVQLDSIPQVNGTDGYAAGDAAIQAAARVVEGIAIRAGGTACRYSGRRLAIVLPQAGTDEARVIAAEIEADLHGDHTVRTGIGAWRVHDTEGEVVARARRMLETADESPAPTNGKARTAGTRAR